MENNDLNTETLIMNAAKKVFVMKGFDGTKMQDIADEANINKALLHYYFRSKDKLFDAVFMEALKEFLPKISFIMNNDDGIEGRLKNIINTYIEMLQRNPHFPIFLFHEVNRNPDRLLSMFKEMGKINPSLLEIFINKELQERGKPPIKIAHLMSNVIGMCLFPFIAAPMLKKLFFEGDAEAFNKFLEERKAVIYEAIIKYLNLN